MSGYTDDPESESAEPHPPSNTAHERPYLFDENEDEAESFPPPRRVQLIALIVVVVLALLVAAVLLIAPDTASTDTGLPRPTNLPTELQASVIPARAVVTLAGLPDVTTYTTVSAAPADVTQDQVPTGQIVHPHRQVPVFAQPGGEPIAAVPPQQISTETWLPVIADEPGWVQVLLPSRPNGSTGWLSTQDNSLDTAHTPYRIVVDRARFRLTLYRDDQQIGAWTVGIGKPAAATPPGRTFVLASIRDPQQTFSPVILPLGIHSASHETYGGGPGTTGIHGWPTTAVFGRPSSDGCVRVPADALHTLSTDVPLGTPVLIS